MVPAAGGKLLRVRYRPRATHSRQPRQVRKEATVTSSGVCSGIPVPGFFYFCDGFGGRGRPPLHRKNQIALASADYPINASVGVVKLARLGKTEGKSVEATPNHCASVAAYWSIDVVGTHRPSPVASSGPFTASVGNVP